MEFTIIGSGNVAYYLAEKLNIKPHSVGQIYSRNTKTGRALAKSIKCDFVSDISKLKTNTDVFIITVNDDEIENVSKQIKFENNLVIHTSGATELNVIEKCSKNIGVVYPLISITKKDKALPQNFPICVEANNTQSLKICKRISKCLSGKCIEVNSKAREALHLSAVLVNNFGNHLFVQADELLNENNLKLELLEPIIFQTAERIKKSKPENVQTGPAVRNDKKVLKKHLQIISKNKHLTSLYKSFSKSIFEKNKNQ